MTTRLPELYVARHGETAWSLTGQHTGLTNLPLTKKGERNAQRLRRRLEGKVFARVFTSPLERAFHTCQIAGYGPQADIDEDLLEWDYGDFEGMTPDEIRRFRPHWLIFRDGCPNGESAQDVLTRASQVLARVKAIDGDVLLFSSGHFLRILATCWVCADPTAGQYLNLGTAALSVLGYGHNTADPVIQLWNDCSNSCD